VAKQPVIAAPTHKSRRSSPIRTRGRVALGAPRSAKGPKFRGCLREIIGAWHASNKLSQCVAQQVNSMQPESDCISPKPPPRLLACHANEQIGLYQGKLYVADPKGRFGVKWSSNCNLAPESLHKSGRSGPLKSRQLANPFFTDTSIQLPSRVRLRKGLQAAAQPQAQHEPPSFATSTRESYRLDRQVACASRRVRFGLTNFPDVLGPVVRWPDGTGWRVRLEAPNHVVSVGRKARLLGGR